jgi:hypothetical protein
MISVEGAQFFASDHITKSVLLFLGRKRVVQWSQPKFDCPVGIISGFKNLITRLLYSWGSLKNFNSRIGL